MGYVRVCWTLAMYNICISKLASTSRNQSFHIAVGHNTMRPDAMGSLMIQILGQFSDMRASNYFEVYNKADFLCECRFFSSANRSLLS